MKKNLSTVIILLGLSLNTEAQEHITNSNVFSKNKDEMFFGIDSGTFIGSSLSVYSGKLQLGLRLEDIGFHIQLPLIMQSASPAYSVLGDFNGAELGNLGVGVFYKIKLNEDSNLRLTARFGLPTAQKQTKSYVINGNSALSRGVWDYYQNIPGAVTPGLGVLYSLKGDRYLIQGQFNTDILIITDSSTHLMFQLRGLAAYRFGKALDLGMAIQTTISSNKHAVSTTRNDFVFFAMEPFIQTDLEMDFPLFARLGFLMNINEPLGFSFDKDKFWSLNLAIGSNVGL